MSYLCQNCKSNNNGWCTVRKCNGLKKLNITSCNTYEDKNIDETKIMCGNENVIDVIKTKSITRGERAKLKPVDDYSDLESNSEAYRVLGKRHMLWNIQMQIAAINKDVPEEERYNALLTCIKSFLQIQEFEEKLYHVDKIIDSIIDSDMIEQSKRLGKLL